MLYRIRLDLIHAVLGLGIEVNCSINIEITIIRIINYNLLTSSLSLFWVTRFGQSGAFGIAVKGC